MQKIVKYLSENGKEYDTPLMALRADIEKELKDTITNSDYNSDSYGLSCVLTDDLHDMIWEFRDLIQAYIARREAGNESLIVVDGGA